uniref:NR LBD domain-containing protein n=1 Tax=Pristionchus pacificus TaxID=54126 RepID=A0A8R1UKM4_PRIPA
MKYRHPSKKRSRKKARAAIASTIPAIALPSTIAVKYSLICRMGHEYKQVSQSVQSLERRLVLEKAYIFEYDLKPFEHPNEDFYIGNFASFYGIFRLALKESMQLLENVIEDYNSLPTSSRIILFRNFFSRFCMVECVYLTAKYFKNRNIFMASLITVADLDEMEPWVDDVNDVEDKSSFLEMFHSMFPHTSALFWYSFIRHQLFTLISLYFRSVKTYTNEFIDLLFPLINMDEMTEMEFHALAVLCFCDNESSRQLPVEVTTILDKTRMQVFDELQVYYRNELNMHDFSQRLGNLMTIAHGTAEAGNLMHKEMRLYSTVFDFCSDDRLLVEFFKD